MTTHDYQGAAAAKPTASEIEQPQAVEPAMAPSQNTTTSQATNFNIDSFPLLYLEVQIND